MDPVSITYSVILEPEADGGFSVIVPALPEAHTQGDTIEEALANAREVIIAVVTDRRKHGDDVPPSDVGAVVTRVTIAA
jgi:antitoxin HicB